MNIQTIFLCWYM